VQATAIAINSRYLLGIAPPPRPTVLSNSKKAENSVGATRLKFAHLF
jgi:hypothetical protein